MDFLFCKELLPKPLEYDVNGLITATQNAKSNYSLSTSAPYAVTYFFRIDQAITNSLLHITYANTGGLQVRGSTLRRSVDGGSVLGFSINSEYVLNKQHHNVAVSIEITTGGITNLALYWNGGYVTYSGTQPYGSQMYVLPAITAAPYAVVYDRVLSKTELDYVSKVYNYKNPIGG